MEEQVKQNTDKKVSKKDKAVKHTRSFVGQIDYKLMAILLGLTFGLALMIAGYMYFFTGNGSEISDLKLTNVTANSVTVTWRTSEPEFGAIAYSTDNNWKPFINPTDKNLAFDDRNEDYDVEAGYYVDRAVAYYTHHVTVRDLEPNSKYYFRVIYDTKVQNDLDYPVIETAPESFATQVPFTVSGQIASSLGTTNFNKEAIVFVTVSDSVTNKEASTLSTTVDDNGGYTLDISNLVSSDGTEYMDGIDEYDNVAVDVMSAKGIGNGYAFGPILDANPLVPIYLYTEDDYKNMAYVSGNAYAEYAGLTPTTTKVLGETTCGDGQCSQGGGCESVGTYPEANPGIQPSCNLAIIERYAGSNGSCQYRVDSCEDSGGTSSNNSNPTPQPEPAQQGDKKVSDGEWAGRGTYCVGDTLSNCSSQTSCVAVKNCGAGKCDMNDPGEEATCSGSTSTTTPSNQGVASLGTTVDGLKSKWVEPGTYCGSDGNLYYCPTSSFGSCSVSDKCDQSCQVRPPNTADVCGEDAGQINPQVQEPTDGNACVGVGIKWTKDEEVTCDLASKKVLNDGDKSYTMYYQKTTKVVYECVKGNWTSNGIGNVWKKTTVSKTGTSLCSGDESNLQGRTYDTERSDIKSAYKVASTAGLGGYKVCSGGAIVKNGRFEDGSPFVINTRNYTDVNGNTCAEEVYTYPSCAQDHYYTCKNAQGEVVSRRQSTRDLLSGGVNPDKSSVDISYSGFMTNEQCKQKGDSYQFVSIPGLTGFGLCKKGDVLDLDKTVVKDPCVPYGNYCSGDQYCTLVSDLVGTDGNNLGRGGYQCKARDDAGNSCDPSLPAGQNNCPADKPVCVTDVTVEIPPVPYKTHCQADTSNIVTAEDLTAAVSGVVTELPGLLEVIFPDGQLPNGVTVETAQQDLINMIAQGTVPNWLTAEAKDAVTAYLNNGNVPDYLSPDAFDPNRFASELATYIEANGEVGEVFAPLAGEYLPLINLGCATNQVPQNLCDVFKVFIDQMNGGTNSMLPNSEKIVMAKSNQKSILSNPVQAGGSYDTVTRSSVLGASDAAPWAVVGGKLVLKDTGAYEISFGKYKIVAPKVYVSEAGKGVKVNFFLDFDGDGKKDEIDQVLDPSLYDISVSKDDESKVYNIQEGWNSMAFPVYQNKVNTLGDIYTHLYNQGIKVTDIGVFRSGKWFVYSYDYARQRFFGSDIEIAPSEGVFVKSNNDGQFIMSGRRYLTGVPAYYSEGWNFVGIVGTSKDYTGTSLLEALKAKEIEANQITRWGDDSRFHSLVVKNGVPYGMFEVDKIDDTTGYFVKVDSGSGVFQP